MSRKRALAREYCFVRVNNWKLVAAATSFVRVEPPQRERFIDEALTNGQQRPQAERITRHAQPAAWSPLTWAAATRILGRSNHLVSNAALRSLLERNLPYRKLELARLPVHVVTSELNTGQAVVLSSGPAVPALLASCAIPGIFPPDQVATAA